MNVGLRRKSKSGLSRCPVPGKHLFPVVSGVPGRTLRHSDVFAIFTVFSLKLSKLLPLDVDSNCWKQRLAEKWIAREAIVFYDRASVSYCSARIAAYKSV
jgi:hypothetical protein